MPDPSTPPDRASVRKDSLHTAADEIERLRSVLRHIATMECLARDGEEPAHLLMMRLAREALHIRDHANLIRIMADAWIAARNSAVVLDAIATSRGRAMLYLHYPLKRISDVNHF